MAFDIYKDIAERTGGDVYIGVVGPVRTGKSTFIKRFMETLVIPGIEDKNALERALDELPQSADGKTIMTTQPRFVPAESVRVNLGDDVVANVRMVDCVGYLTTGAIGHEENGRERLVRTPWSDKEIPFTEAAEIGTKRVMQSHSTIGVVVTTDGSISELARADYVAAEERVISEMKSTGKPFVVVLNTRVPKDEQTEKLRLALQDKYGVPVSAMDVINMQETDVHNLLTGAILEFPVREVNVDFPKWMQVLPRDNELISAIIDRVSALDGIKMNAGETYRECFTDIPGIQSVNVTAKLGQGAIDITLTPEEEEFYKVLSKECGTEVKDDYKLLAYVRKQREAGEAYEKLKFALQEVEETGYGIVRPTLDDMCLDEPQIMKQGGRFGVRLKASAPSLHIMKVDVETEVSPIVGTEQQGEEMVRYLMSEFESNPQNIWDTNIFGKSLSSLVSEGLKNKLTAMPADARNKLRKTVFRIVNEGKGGVVCILL